MNEHHYDPETGQYTMPIGGRNVPNITTTQTHKFVATLLEAGVSPENAVLEGYRFALAMTNDTMLSINMEAAAHVIQLVARTMGIDLNSQRKRGGTA